MNRIVTSTAALAIPLVFASSARAQCQLGKFAGSAVPASGDFGRAISADGATAAIGAPFDGLTGAVYVFEKPAGAWVETARLVPSDSASYLAAGEFGTSVALSGDTLLVGASHAGAGAAGAAYVFERQAGAWAETATLLPAATVNMLWFGSSVALDGDRAAIGASGAANQSGAVYVFERQGGVWTQTAELLASDATANDDHLGQSVALAGDLLAAGAPDDSDLGAKAGAAYVFALVAGAWVEEQELHAADSGSPEQFGFSVALEGATLAVGGIKGDAKIYFGAVTDNGRVFVFERQAGAWIQTELLFAPDGWAGENFGSAVAIEAGRLAVGVPFDDALGDLSGSVYVYHRAGTRWILADKLVAADELPRDELGTSLAFAGDELLVGAAKRNETALDSGAVYVFSSGGPHCPGTPCAQDKLISSGPISSYVQLGRDVALAGDHALAVGYQVPPHVFRAAGTFWEETAKLPLIGIAAVALVPLGGGFRALLGNPEANTLHIWTGSGASWSQEVALTPSDAGPGKGFGGSVAAEGDLCVVGAEVDDLPGFANAGSAYVFRKTGGTWSEEAKLVPADPTANAYFGISAALAGDVALIGASSVGGMGAAYAFRYDSGVWVQEAKLLPSDAGGAFGYSVAFDGEYAAIGSIWNDEFTHPDAQAGAVYLFRRNAGLWTPIGKLHPDVVQEGGSLAIPASTAFGNDVALDGDRLIVGAPAFDTSPIDTGLVWLFRRDATDQWSKAGRIKGYDGLWGGHFGSSVALQGELALIGAYDDGEAAIFDDAGAVYAYSLDGSACPSLAAHSFAVPYLAGGSQDFALRAPASAAGDLYWVLGSVTGVSPPTPILGALLPLAYDIYFELTLFQPGALPLKSSVGFLDSAAAAHAQLELPGIIYGLLQGTRVYHAFGSIDLATLAASHVSNPVRLLIK